MSPRPRSLLRRQALALVLRGAYLRRSLWLALLVGSALNLINQPAALLGDATIVWPKLLLTYCVPFLVASYGAWSAVLSALYAQRASCDTPGSSDYS